MYILNGINQIKSMELNECMEWDKSNIIEKNYIHLSLKIPLSHYFSSD